MAYFLAPIVNDQQVDSNGAPLSGGSIYTYLAGTSSAYPTYTDNTGLTPQANPIVLNSLGLPSSPIWLTGGISYKFTIRDALGVLQRTIDNISGINDANVSVSQWVTFGSAPTYISATSFSVAGDQTGTFQVARRIQATVTAGVVYGTITAAVFGTVTTVTVKLDSGALDSGSSTIALGLLTPANPSYTPIPIGTVMSFFQAAAPTGWTQITTHDNKAMRVVSGTGGGSGGSVAFTTAFASQAVTGSNSATTLTIAQIPSHAHSGVDATGGQNVGSASAPSVNVSNTGLQGGGGSHNHTFTGTAINMAVQYIDMILASKN
jgi:hypothetical protein